MKWLFILAIAGLVIFKNESISFACGGCSTKAWAQEKADTDTSKPAKAESKLNIKEVYQCPNCRYEQDKPGKCPTCKSDLIENDVHYKCPMSKTSDIKSGKCPKCGMELKKETNPVDKPKHLD